MKKQEPCKSKSRNRDLNETPRKQTTKQQHRKNNEDKYMTTQPTISIIIPVGKEGEDLYNRILKFKREMDQTAKQHNITYELILVTDLHHKPTLKAMTKLARQNIAKEKSIETQYPTQENYRTLLDTNTPITPQTTTKATPSSNLNTQKPKLSIIIPTYNERDNIPELIKRLEKTLKDINYEIIFVDDNSPDGTAEVIRKYMTKNPKIKLIVRHKKMGLTTAMIDGFLTSRGELVAFMDADLQHPPELLPTLYRLVAEKGYDIAIASRYVKGAKIQGWPLWRRIVSKGAILLAHLLIPQTRKVKDPLSGYFLAKRTVLEPIIETIQKRHRVQKSVFGKILLETLAQIHALKVIEKPYTFTNRRCGQSKMPLSIYPKYIWYLLTLSNYFTLKYIAIATIAALLAKYTTPTLGITSLALSILIRWLTLHKELPLKTLLIAETTSTTIKKLITYTLHTTLAPLTTISWIIATATELFLIHRLR
ncbi:MAG: hypothetical protein DRJ40_02740 [Thermoprotei archaeon]|nr:MAG: hypothetical protein DRJ40_02740 [Thermoprotei archaeon]